MRKMFALLFLSSVSFASAPQQKTQAPGFYRSMIGDIEVTSLLDGFFPMKPKETLLKPAKNTNANLKKEFQSDASIPTSVNAFLINTGSRLILVDSGMGVFVPGFGHVISNLKAAGYQPEQVDEVVITHMHTDHLGGVVLDGKAAFPNADLRIDQNDIDFWANPNMDLNAPAQVQGMIKNSIAALAPYKAAGKLKPFHGKTVITTGVTALPYYGHTQGHTAYEISSKGKKLLLIGDTLHIASLQFADPNVSMQFDSDSKKALESRKAIFEQAATEGFLIGAAHLDFPGIGHVLKTGKGSYRYLPMPYAPLE
jgi:glyoxylase-like metal-dependent hydrolase (beta-lactamase superfamily II)